MQLKLPSKKNIFFLKQYRKKILQFLNQPRFP